MESEDASNEEASHCNLPKTDLLNNQLLEAISMLLMTATEDHLKRGSVMAITERFNMACSMIHRIWKRAEHMHAMGIINSPNCCPETIPGECLSICQSSLRRVSRVYC